MKFLPYIFLAITLTGCGSDSNHIDTQIVGKWQTQSCVQPPNDSGGLEPFWVTSVYEFTEVGSVLRTDNGYSDSNCITNTFSSNPAQVATYADIGPATTPQGLDGSKMTMQATTAAGVPTGPGPVTGFYAIVNNELCYSQTYILDSYSSGVSPTNSQDINFSNCLTPVNTP